MIQYRKNQIDCFKPWESKKYNSCSPLRNTKSTNQHRVAFADNCNQARNISLISSKHNQSLHPVFVNHLRHQLPQLIKDSCTTITHKHSKDNQNLKVKNIYNKTSKHEKITNHKKNQYIQNNEHSTESDGKTNTINKLYSSSESEITSESTKKSVYRNQSVKNVIEKFNKLSGNSNNNLRQERIKSPSKTRKEIILTNNELQNSSKESPCKLRSQKLLLKFTNNTNKIFDDEISNQFYLKPVKNCGKTKTKETQTTPAPSATNILINVYNQKTPRIIHKMEEIVKGSVQINISENKDDNKINLLVMQNEIWPKREVEISKKSVRTCIEKFEENLKKNGCVLDKDISDVNIFTKIKSAYLMKQQYETLLSPKAKSVPF